MSVTAPAGFTASGITAGIKDSGKPDLALVVNTGPEFVAAAVTTPNRFCAAPVYLTREVAEGGRAKAVVLNSGGANACTGERGMDDAYAMAEQTAAQVGCEPGEVMVCSTGLIGAFLLMDIVTAGIAQAAYALSDSGGEDAAVAIMTTDTVPKTAQVSTAGFTVGGMSKGAGMLNPAMATMLAVITTDAAVSVEVAQRALQAGVAVSFNRMDSDGCQSTNDTVILLANGASGVSASEADLTAAVTEVCTSLTKQMLADAEGASHTIAVTVSGAASEAAAEAAARTVTSSNLFKAAIFGGDPNWGRILSALGTLPEDECPYDREAVSVAMNGTPIFAGGAPQDGASSVDLSAHDVTVDIDLAAGEACVTVWTNDLTHDYVEENSAYST
ncbi:bifunctional ornithine acetyltransferase/N-acetylglutamate synthase [Bowdeniella nasicola]|uniref:Arginine biosynthesis bifunctional protein ArgJ n=1 Tax=Bowdeniella nasicola TaxID=208480 RepID=A0A1Q5Q0V4_9ACTO|nr:bifunctional glutamate N-acetyltransferase/amino-acid acetyltransferase ArgJ [Bowdeniella nasicola]OKL53493.1 bifunctional ornithine acetyltransferase/N-acetylglutamate synthase [Bowdeniella nasicola]